MKTREQIICLEAQYIIEHNATVRQASKELGRSKSTIHYDIRRNLPYINKALAIQVEKILENNKQERTIRGGLATQAKYRKERLH
jgi:putative DeoR family transcriptional regulator (stage III sporulation protein D)